MPAAIVRVVFAVIGQFYDPAVPLAWRNEVFD
jgi:hypothetical protein